MRRGSLDSRLFELMVGFVDDELRFRVGRLRLYTCLRCLDGGSVRVDPVGRRSKVASPSGRCGVTRSIITRQLTPQTVTHHTPTTPLIRAIYTSRVFTTKLRCHDLGNDRVGTNRCQVGVKPPRGQASPNCSLSICDRARALVFIMLQAVLQTITPRESAQTRSHNLQG